MKKDILQSRKFKTLTMHWGDSFWQNVSVFVLQPRSEGFEAHLCALHPAPDGTTETN